MRKALCPAAVLCAAILSCALTSAASADDSTPAMQALIREAQAEGKVEVLLSGQVPAQLRPVMPLFQKKYGITVNFQTGGGEQNGQRMLAERRVGRYTLDVWLGGANTALVQLIPNKALVPVKDLLIDPEVTDVSKWYKGRHYYVDIEQQYIFAFGAQPLHTISYNTKLVKPDEIKSYFDLLDPKWNGKMVSWSPHVEGAGILSVAMYLHPKIGEDWFIRWARDMKVTIVNDVRQGAEWVALGRFPLGIFGIGTQADKLRGEGFPIAGFFPHPMAEGEMLSNSATNIMAMDRAPNPKAAQLFVNWVLTREVQQEILKASGRSDSLRVDVDNSVVPEAYRRDPNIDYWVPFVEPRYQKEQTQVINRLREIMKQYGHL